jgi:hypothetical protein
MHECKCCMHILHCIWCLPHCIYALSCMCPSACTVVYKACLHAPRCLHCCKEGLPCMSTIPRPSFIKHCTVGHMHAALIILWPMASMAQDLPAEVRYWSVWREQKQGKWSYQYHGKVMKGGTGIKARASAYLQYPESLDCLVWAHNGAMAS